mmetsp:Transcript_53408/g.79370  ORF Transcript_53408/g.79370 Transcript_53408/m.79370 type:complete len:300 (+) Transcript_53408:104-1003(+)
MIYELTTFVFHLKVVLPHHHHYLLQIRRIAMRCFFIQPRLPYPRRISTRLRFQIVSLAAAIPEIITTCLIHCDGGMFGKSIPYHPITLTNHHHYQQEEEKKLIVGCNNRRRSKKHPCHHPFLIMTKQSKQHYCSPENMIILHFLVIIVEANANSSKHNQKKNPFCHIHKITVEKEEHQQHQAVDALCTPSSLVNQGLGINHHHDSSAQASETYTVSITGNRFLYKMCRYLVGVIVSVGIHKIPLEEVEFALQNGRWDDDDDDSTSNNNINNKIECAPPHGLFLHHVDYGDEVELNWLET